MPSFSKTRIQNYLLNRAGLNSKRNLNKVLNDLGCIQVDPVNVVSRSHELSMYNRISGFKKQDLYDELYKKHSLIEYWMQLYSIIPAKAFPYLMAITEKPGERHVKLSGSWHQDYYDEHKQEIKAVKTHIKKHGPTCSRDLTHMPKARAILSWQGNNSQVALLEYLWSTGQVQVAYREGNTKYYDLTERLLNKQILKQTVTANKGYKYLLDTYFSYFGIVRTTNLGRSGRARAKGLRKEFKRQLEQKEIVQIELTDVNTKYFVKKDQLQVLEEAKSHSHIGLNILAPLDPLIIDRQLLLDAFGFFYRWEGYTPKAKRKVGYYNMPVLYKGKFVGQIDAKADRSGKKLDILNTVFDNESKQLTASVEQELSSLEQFALSV